MFTRRDDGFTVAELMVALVLMGLVLTMVVGVIFAVNRSNEVSGRQSAITHDISTPLNAMDEVLSQNKAIENGGGLVSDSFTLTTRSPRYPSLGNDSFRYVYSAGTDGRLTETIYRIPNGGSPELRNTVVWSTTNANRARGALFTYLDSSGTPTTTPSGATSVLVDIWSSNGGEFFHGERRIFFRNR